MATLPTESQLQTVWSNLTALNVATLNFANATSPNYVTLFNTLSDSLYPDHARAESDAITTSRAALASTIGTPNLTAEYGPLLLTYARVLGVPERDAQGIIDRIYARFAANGYTVKSRSITYGSVSAGGSNVGNGTMLRLTVDEHNFPIESVYCEGKSATCVADQHSGATRQQETFELRGQGTLRDDLENSFSGFIGQANAISGLGTSQYLNNPSFDTISGGTDAIPTGIQGWTIDTIANVEVGRNSGEYYRDYVGATSPGGLLLKGDVEIEQALSRVTSWNTSVPAYFQLAIKRLTGADGTLTIDVGAQQFTVDVATLTVDQWTVKRLGPGDQNWFVNWNEDGAAIRVTWSGRTAGQLRIDDVLFYPWTLFGSQVTGTWVAIVGAETSFLVDDTFSFTDIDGATGKNQTWLFRAYGRYLPSTAGTPTWADPS